MHDETEDLRQLSYWPSVSDLFMTLFIISLVLVATFFFVMVPTSPDRYKEVIEVLGGPKLDKIRQPTNEMRAALNLPLIGQNAEAEEVLSQLAETAAAVVRFVKQSPSQEDVTLLRQQLEEAKRKLAEVEKKLVEKQIEIDKLTAELSEQRKINGDLVGKIDEISNSDKPQIIKIEEPTTGKEKTRFDRGKALVKPDFRIVLRSDKFEQLKKQVLAFNVVEGKPRFDTLEIIGHTDGVEFTHSGNLDSFLPILLAKGFDAPTPAGKGVSAPIFEMLTAGSNNDLGLLRALAIKKEWRDFVAIQPDAEKAKLQLIEVRCYSAGQTIPEGILSNDPKARDIELYKKETPLSRRIELRLTKLQ